MLAIRSLDFGKILSVTSSSRACWSVGRLVCNDFLLTRMSRRQDFVLGINLYSFTDFQDKLSATDPGELHRLASIRSTAIETCSQQLLTEGEHRQAGWTLLSPTSDSQEEIQTHGFEEKVLLLSEKALYIISYEYSLQKVRMFVSCFFSKLR